MDLAFPESKINMLQSFYTGKCLRDIPHRKYNILFHISLTCFLTHSIIATLKNLLFLGIKRAQRTGLLIPSILLRPFTCETRRRQLPPDSWQLKQEIAILYESS